MLDVDVVFSFPFLPEEGGLPAWLPACFSCLSACLAARWFVASSLASHVGP